MLPPSSNSQSHHRTGSLEAEPSKLCYNPTCSSIDTVCSSMAAWVMQNARVYDQQRCQAHSYRLLLLLLLLQLMLLQPLLLL